MASDWSVVAGTAVGAASGLVTLMVSRRYEARNRAEERALAVRQQLVAQRRLAYADLLRRARELYSAVLAVFHTLGGWGPHDPTQWPEIGDRADAAWRAYGDVASSVELTAADQRVVDLAIRFRDEAQSAISKGSLVVDRFATSEMIQRTFTERAQSVQPHLGLMYDLLPHLREACRDELGVR